MDLKKNSFFKKKINPHQPKLMMKNGTLLSNLKNIKYMAKLAHLRKKTFSSLIFQINNDLKTGYNAISDEQEHFENFNKARVDINSIKHCDPIPSAILPKHKSENPFIAEIRSLKATLDSVST